MARPRKASDDEVFAAVHQIMGRLGPSQWTLADVAGLVGLTASALVQRFGSKRGLQIAFTERWGESAPDLFALLRRQATTPLGIVRAWADFFARLGDTPEGLANHLAYLQLDLTEPAMRAALQRQTRDTRAALLALLREAVDAGELRSLDDTAAERLARLLEVVVTGSTIVSGMNEENARAAARRDVDELLRLYGAEGPLDPHAA